MEQESSLQTVLRHSTLNISETLTNIATELKPLLKDGISVPRLPTYSHELSVIADLIRCSIGEQKDCNQLQDDITKDVLNLLLDLSENICLPLVRMVSPSVDSRSEIIIFVGKLGQILAECAYVNSQCLVLILDDMEKSVILYLKEKPTTFDFQNDHSLVDIHTVLEVLRQVLNKVVQKRDEAVINNNLAKFSKLFIMLCEALDLLSVDLVATLCIPVLLKLVQLDSKETNSNVAKIWTIIQVFDQSKETRKVFLLLCGFANYFIPTDGVKPTVDIRKEVHFWKILQEGLYSKDSVNRKRALYLLKRVVDICESTGEEINTDGTCSVFWWSKNSADQLSKTWEDFMLLAEVLEEKQVLKTKKSAKPLIFLGALIFMNEPNQVSN